MLFENYLVHAPYQIFNIDETGMPLNPKPPTVICQRGHKNPSVACGSGKSQITYVNAGGNCLPPMIIWKGKGRDKSRLSGYNEIPGTLHGFSTNGWIDQDLFNLWFHNIIFLRYTPARPLVLYL